MVLLLVTNKELFCTLQENFKKNSFGLIHLVEVGGKDSIAAIKALGDAHDLRPSSFRGAENLIPPDVASLLLWSISEW